MTVQEVIDDLKKYPGHAKVLLATSPSNTLTILSIYSDNQKVVWIDLEDI